VITALRPVLWAVFSSPLRHNADQPVLVEMDVEGKRCGNLEAAHQREGRAVREREFFVAVSSEDLPSLHNVNVSDFENLGQGGIEEAIPS
jgi:hypothetical protein